MRRAAENQISIVSASNDAKAARAPRPPEDLVDARQDRIHVEKGRLLAARKIPKKAGK